MAMYPGVHIFETTKLSLASNGMSGLRPLLVGRFYNNNGNARTLEDGVLEVDNWMSFSEKCTTSPLVVTIREGSGLPDIAKNAESSATAGDPSAEEVPEKAPGKSRAKQSGTPKVETNINTGMFALRHYFDNGGGPCLLLSYGKDDSSNISRISDILTEYDEISLLAVIDAESKDLAAINIELDNVMTTNQQAFLITHHADIDKLPPVRGSNATRTATYAPDLLTGYTYSLDDNNVLIRLEEEGGDDSDTSLAELRANQSKKNLYQLADQELDTFVQSQTVSMPIVLSPCAAVAGAYCRTERQVGIWKAPANVALVGAMPTVAVTADKHGKLNDQGVNVITWLPRSGTTIMGARTLEDENKTAWRYVPVRLLFNTVERDLRAMVAPVVFEPNSLATWQSVRSGIENYLYNLWKKGGLYGTSPEQAYSVNIGLDTMSETDIGNGVLRARIGLAALRPAEFVYLVFTQDVQNLASA